MNPKSKFNKLGLNICKNYSKILKKDVLLKVNNLFYAEDDSDISHCLKCGNELEVNNNPYSIYNKECKKCKIIY